MRNDVQPDAHTEASRSTQIPIAGVGASAGGVAALQTFFKVLPPDTGAAYVVIVHLDPEHQSDLPHILGACTQMPVVQVAESHTIEANKVYVIPPNRRLLVSADQIATAPFD